MKQTLNDKFKPGMKVRCNQEFFPQDIVGVVVDNKCLVTTQDIWVGVDFKEDFPFGHDLGGRIDTFTGWYFSPCHLDIVEEEEENEVGECDEDVAIDFGEPDTVTAERFFNVGDKVICTSKQTRPFGRIGTVMGIDDNDGSYAVAFKDFDGHSCHGLCPNSDGWWLYGNCLEYAPEITSVVIDKDNHYKIAIQPIEFMQAALSKDEFIGFLKGNIIKYVARCGRKDAPAEEVAKIIQYAKWLEQALNGEIIVPEK